MGLDAAWHWLVKRPRMMLVLGVSSTDLNFGRSGKVGGVEETSRKPIFSFQRVVKGCESWGLNNPARASLGRMDRVWPGKEGGRESSSRGSSRHGGLVLRCLEQTPHWKEVTWVPSEVSWDQLEIRLKGKVEADGVRFGSFTWWQLEPLYLWAWNYSY